MSKTKFDIFMPAGGIGKRLGAITKNKPKPLIKIFNREFIQYVIDSLIKSNFDTLNLMISYKKDLFKSIKLPNIKFNLIEDKNRRGTFNCLFQAKTYIKKNFIYSNSDEIIDEDIRKLVNIFETRKLDILQLYFLDRKGVPIDKKFIINKKKYDKNKLYTEAGLKILNKNFFKKKTKLSYRKLEDYILDNRKNFNIKFYIIDKRPFSIDTSNRILRTKKYLQKKIRS